MADGTNGQDYWQPGNDVSWCLWEMCGSWMDNNGSLYNVSLSCNEWSLDVHTTRPDGSIKASRQQVYTEWNSQTELGRILWSASRPYFLVSFNDKELAWNRLGGSNPFVWERVPTIGPVRDARVHDNGPSATTSSASSHKTPFMQDDKCMGPIVGYELDPTSQGTGPPCSRKVLEDHGKTSDWCRRKVLTARLQKVLAARLQTGVAESGHEDKLLQNYSRFKAVSRETTSKLL